MGQMEREIPPAAKRRETSPAKKYAGRCLVDLIVRGELGGFFARPKNPVKGRVRNEKRSGTPDRRQVLP